jgi:hypothetical protein
VEELEQQLEGAKHKDEAMEFVRSFADRQDRVLANRPRGVLNG